MKPAAIIYLVTNMINGKRYVGLTRSSVLDRWRQHQYNAKTGLRTYFYSAIRKYGAENFSVTSIASCPNVADASEVEREAIKSLRPEYNQTNGGEFTVGKRVPREVVERIIAKNTGLKRTPEMNAANSAQAKSRYENNPEYKAKILLSLEKGRANCDQQKRIEAVRAVRVGTKMSDEARAHLSKLRTGMRHSKEVLERIAEKHKRPVECVTLGVTFDSVSEAAEHLGLSISGVSSVCRGKRNSANGLTFQFI